LIQLDGALEKLARLRMRRAAVVPREITAAQYEVIGF
jgi:hypothetical protein